MQGWLENRQSDACVEEFANQYGQHESQARQRNE
jgi:hypothetical protein